MPRRLFLVREIQRMKKRLVFALCAAAGVMGLIASCAKAGDEITVISREEGSGTRGAFVSLFGIERKDADGKTVDMTVETADVTNSTAVVISGVAENERAIGYISLGALGNSVKALSINGVAAAAEHIRDKTYPAARPFIIAVREDVPPAARDFIAFMVSKEGQAVIEKAGYVSVGAGAAGGAPGGVSGKVTVAGSSSVTPAMEKLKEAYSAVNPAVEVEIQQSDSTMGVSNAIDGVCDIGMASRDLKQSELDRGIRGIAIALDGIAVIVNPKNTLSSLTSEQVRGVYTGEIVKWSELAK
jgi:phosphate transport system substrate-binding protein